VSLRSGASVIAPLVPAFASNREVASGRVGGNEAPNLVLGGDIGCKSLAGWVGLGDLRREFLGLEVHLDGATL